MSPSYDSDVLFPLDMADAAVPRVKCGWCWTDGNHSSATGSRLQGECCYLGAQLPDLKWAKRLFVVGQKTAPKDGQLLIP
jgi:hypothetical protein